MAAERKRLRSGQARIAVVGGGKMGEAILGGWIAAREGAASAWDASCMTVVDPGEERRRHLEDAYGVACVDDVVRLQDADLVLLSVKPQVMASVLEQVRKLSFAPDALFVSIAAGLSTEKLEGMLPEGAHVVRVMPNTPLLVGKGASTLCGGSQATQEEVDLVLGLFSCIGEAFVVPEGQIDVTCAIHGAGPAYVAALIEALARAGVEAGLDRDLAERLGTQTAYGTACLMLERGQNAERTRVDVCSPGGATLAALDAMEAAGFSESIARGVKAAIRRSKELGA
jgi:pyrroline-5-carboxylate reductase